MMQISVMESIKVASVWGDLEEVWPVARALAAVEQQLLDSPVFFWLWMSEALWWTHSHEMTKLNKHNLEH